MLHTSAQPLPLEVDGMTLKWTTSNRVLGVILDSSMTFEEHRRKSCGIVRGKLERMRRQGVLAGARVSRRLARTYILGYILGRAEFCATATVRSKEWPEMASLQMNAARSLLNVPLHTSRVRTLCVAGLIDIENVQCT